MIIVRLSGDYDPRWRWYSPWDTDLDRALRALRRGDGDAKPSEAAEPGKPKTKASKNSDVEREPPTP